VTPDERWLAAAWPFVSDQLPPAPAGVLEVGCGPLGGFVPALLGGGYEAVGVDPEAPEGPGYHQVEFERYQSPKPVECVVASTSLHHVADLDEVLDRVKTTLVADGVLVVEWAWERFDEATARWCFARLAPPASAARWRCWPPGARTKPSRRCWPRGSGRFTYSSTPSRRSPRSRMRCSTATPTRSSRRLSQCEA